MTFLEFQRAGSNHCWSGKGGEAETREEQPRNNSAALGQGPHSTSRDIHSNIFEVFNRTKTPNIYSTENSEISAIIIERHVLENEEDGLGLRKINQLNIGNYIKDQEAFLLKPLQDFINICDANMTLMGEKYCGVFLLYLFSMLTGKVETCSPTGISSVNFWTILPMKSGFATY